MALLWSLAAVFAVLSTGCVKVYQPVSGLSGPVVIDLDVANFEDVHLAIHCPPTDLVNPEEARALCRKVGTLFENQGATVTTTTTDRHLGDDPLAAQRDQPDDDEASDVEPYDLRMELRGRKVHQATNRMSWALSIATFSLVPGIHEFTFAQDVVIRDETGFLLASETLEGRIVRYSGAGIWLTTKLLDRFWREDEERLIGDRRPHSDVSADLYGQLSQLLFNSKMRWRVQRAANPPVGSD